MLWLNRVGEMLDFQLWSDAILRALGLIASWPVAIFAVVLVLRKQLLVLLTALASRFEQMQSAETALGKFTFGPQADATSPVKEPLQANTAPSSTSFSTGVSEAASATDSTAAVVEKKGDHAIITTPAPPPADALAGAVESVSGVILKDPQFLERTHEQIAPLLADAKVALFCERTYRVIFGSQIEALDLANMPGGAPIAAIKTIYDKVRADYQTVHDKGSFDAWVQWMIVQGLWVVVNNTVSSTLFGKAFLIYKVNLGLPSKLA